MTSTFFDIFIYYSIKHWLFKIKISISSITKLILYTIWISLKWTDSILLSSEKNIAILIIQLTFIDRLIKTKNTILYIQQTDKFTINQCLRINFYRRWIIYTSTVRFNIFNFWKCQWIVHVKNNLRKIIDTFISINKQIKSQLEKRKNSFHLNIF